MPSRTFTVRLPTLHPNQARVKAEAARFNVLACGRRWGKTVFGLDLAINAALRGQRVGWFAPEYKLLDDAWRDLKEILGGVAKPNDQQKHLEFLTGGRIEAWAFDRNPNAGRSRKYHRVIIDEAAHCGNLERAWTKCVRPTLTDWKGDAWFLSSPNGPNYFKVLFDRGGTRIWKSWRQPSHNNPRLDPAEIEDARRDLPDAIFDQEYLAVFLDEILQQLLPTSWVDRCVLAGRPAGLVGLGRALAIDLSKGTGRDRMVAIVGDDLGDLARRISKHVDVPGAANLAKQLSVEWGIPHDRIVYDVGGWAGPDMTRYLEALGIVEAIPYRGGHTGALRFKNKRARSGWKLRQRMDPDRPRMLPQTGPDPNARGWSIADRGNSPAPVLAAVQPPYHILRDEHWESEREELLALRYEYDDARIGLEKKELCQERLGRSPDIADTRIMMASLWED